MWEINNNIQYVTLWVLSICILLLSIIPPSFYANHTTQSYVITYILWTLQSLDYIFQHMTAITLKGIWQIGWWILRILITEIVSRFLRSGQLWLTCSISWPERYRSAMIIHQDYETLNINVMGSRNCRWIDRVAFRRKHQRRRWLQRKAEWYGMGSWILEKQSLYQMLCCARINVDLQGTYTRSLNYFRYGIQYFLAAARVVQLLTAIWATFYKLV